MAPFIWLLGLIIAVMNSCFIYYCISRIQMCECKTRGHFEEKKQCKRETEKSQWSMKA